MEVMNNMSNMEEKDPRMGNCQRCGVYDELYHSEICDSCVTDADFEKWESNDQHEYMSTLASTLCWSKRS